MDGCVRASSIGWIDGGRSALTEVREPRQIKGVFIQAPFIRSCKETRSFRRQTERKGLQVKERDIMSWISVRWSVIAYRSSGGRARRRLFGWAMWGIGGMSRLYRRHHRC